MIHPKVSVSSELRYIISLLQCNYMNKNVNKIFTNAKGIDALPGYGKTYQIKNVLAQKGDIVVA